MRKVSLTRASSLPTDRRDVPGNRIDPNGSSTSYTLTNFAPAIIQSSSGSGQTANINTAFGSDLTATVTKNDLPVAGVSVTFAAPASNTTGTFSDTLTFINVTTNAQAWRRGPVHRQWGRRDLSGDRFDRRWELGQLYVDQCDSPGR